MREADDGGDSVEMAWWEFRLAVTGVVERVVGRSRGRQRKKAMAWWNDEVRDVKSKKDLYRKALNENQMRHGRNTRQ